jgi:hypothetical protein
MDSERCVKGTDETEMAGTGVSAISLYYNKLWNSHGTALSTTSRAPDT